MQAWASLAALSLVLPSWRLFEGGAEFFDTCSTQAATNNSTVGQVSRQQTGIFKAKDRPFT